MSETIPSDISNSTREPIDGLEALRNPKFMHMCVDAENVVNRIHGYQQDRMYELIDKFDYLLGEEYGRHLEQQPVTVSGQVYPVRYDDKGSFRKAKKLTLDQENMKFARIAFAPIEVNNQSMHKIAFRLLPHDKSGDISHYLMLTEDASELTFTKQKREAIDPDKLMIVFARIAKKALEFGKSVAYSSLTLVDKHTQLDEMDEAATALIKPLIEQRVPLLINADKYSTRKGIDTNTHRGAFAAYRQPEKATEMRTILAGRAVKIVHSTNRSRPIVTADLLIEDKRVVGPRSHLISLDEIVSIIPLQNS